MNTARKIITAIESINVLALFSIDSWYVVGAILYGASVIAYGVWIFIEPKQNSRLRTARLSFCIILPILLSIILFFCSYKLLNYYKNIESVKCTDLWDKGIIPAFIGLSLIFSLIAESLYRCIEGYLLNIERDNNKQLVYAATCIPVKRINNNEAVTIFFIKNESHKESQWMFPGGHVKIEDNSIGDYSRKSLEKFNHLPASIVKEKCIDEANIDIKFIDFINNKLVKENYLFNSSECSQTIASVFNMKFLVSESAECYNHNHRIHYDFSYIAKYEKKIGGSRYKSIEIDFVLSDYDFSDESTKKDDAIAKIRVKINSEINKLTGSNEVANKQFFSSIDTLVYHTLKLFNDNKERLKLLDDNS